jgi:FkbM family methyltransferase
VHAACSYEPGEIVLLNSVKSGGTATGGSTVISGAAAESTYGHLYWTDQRPLAKVTLEDLMARLGVDRIDVLKLDCEGSEFSILAGTPSLDRIGFIFGEYHGFNRWEEFRRSRFSGWNYGHMHTGGDLGIFHYENPRHAN